MKKLLVILIMVALVPFTTGCRIDGLWGFDDDSGTTTDGTVTVNNNIVLTGLTPGAIVTYNGVSYTVPSTGNLTIVKSSSSTQKFSYNVGGTIVWYEIPVTTTDTTYTFGTTTFPPTTTAPTGTTTYLTINSRTVKVGGSQVELGLDSTTATAIGQSTTQDLEFLITFNEAVTNATTSYKFSIDNVSTTVNTGVDVASISGSTPTNTGNITISQPTTKTIKVVVNNAVTLSNVAYKVTLSNSSIQSAADSTVKVYTPIVVYITKGAILQSWSALDSTGTLIGTAKAPTATGITVPAATTRKIKMTFDENVQTTTIDTTSFTFKGTSGTTLSYSSFFDAPVVSSKDITFPFKTGVSLTAAKAYTISWSAGSIKDTAGFAIPKIITSVAFTAQ